MQCRRVGKQSMARASSPLHSAGARSAVAGSRQQAALAPSRGASRDMRGGLSSTSSSRPGTGSAAAAAADVQASRVNRTLLMELMHEDDVSGNKLWPAAA
jgi:hypothetical protein